MKKQVRCHGSKTVANAKNRLKTAQFGLKRQKTIKREKTGEIDQNSTEISSKRWKTEESAQNADFRRKSAQNAEHQKKTGQKAKK